LRALNAQLIIGRCNYRESFKVGSAACTNAWTH